MSSENPKQSISKEELEFWASLIDSPRLLFAVDGDRERASRFFGTMACLRRNEKELQQVIWARQLCSRTLKELLTESSRLGQEILKEIEEGPLDPDWAETRASLEKSFNNESQTRQSYMRAEAILRNAGAL
jgi:hypothetical protein